ncbi:MAG TPA: cation:proton antiporter [Thermoplasmata archaeon]|nr:cation:proton antiporter [Thermoplasmata archaeon]
MAGEVQLIILLFGTFLLAKALGELMQRLKQPALVGEILAGVIIANLVLVDFIVPSFSLAEFLQLSTEVSDPVRKAAAEANLAFLGALADLGVIFLIFAVGLHIKSSELRKVGRLAIGVAVMGVVFPFVLGFLYIELTEGTDRVAEAMFVGAALVATSVGITASFLREKNLLKSREAMVILAAAVIDDILGIMVLTIAIGVGTAGSGGPVNLVYQIGIVAALSTFFVLLFLYIGPRFVRRFAAPENPRAILNRLRTRNAAFIVALLFCFGVSALATFFQLAAIIGAFLAGMAFAEVAERYGLVESFEPLNAFFVPFFFLVIGLKVKVGALAAVWPAAVIITVLAIIGKLVGCGLAAREMGRDSAMIVGVGMVPRGEVGIIVAIAALKSGAISEGLYSAIVVMSIATSMLAPSILAKLFARKIGPSGVEPVVTSGNVGVPVGDRTGGSAPVDPRKRESS